MFQNIRCQELFGLAGSVMAHLAMKQSTSYIGTAFLVREVEVD
jgi:hypothetical protein